MKIYVIQEDDYDCYQVLKAFFKKEDAEQLKQRIDDHIAAQPPWITDTSAESMTAWIQSLKQWEEKHPLQHKMYEYRSVSVSEVEVE